MLRNLSGFFGLSNSFNPGIKNYVGSITSLSPFASTSNMRIDASLDLGL
jgi:hypothetical protein